MTPLRPGEVYDTPPPVGKSRRFRYAIFSGNKEICGTGCRTIQEMRQYISGTSFLIDTIAVNESEENYRNKNYVFTDAWRHASTTPVRQQQEVC